MRDDTFVRILFTEGEPSRLLDIEYFNNFFIFEDDYICMKSEFMDEHISVFDYDASYMIRSMLLSPHEEFSEPEDMFNQPGVYELLAKLAFSDDGEEVYLKEYRYRRLTYSDVDFHLVHCMCYTDKFFPDEEIDEYFGRGDEWLLSFYDVLKPNMKSDYY